jgi:hypothetical protein
MKISISESDNMTFSEFKTFIKLASDYLKESSTTTFDDLT